MILPGKYTYVAPDLQAATEETGGQPAKPTAAFIISYFYLVRKSSKFRARCSSVLVKW